MRSLRPAWRRGGAIPWCQRRSCAGARLAVRALVVCAVSLTAAAGATQSIESPDPEESRAFARAAGRALARGAYADAEALAQARGEADPASRTVLARIALAHGRHDRAEALLAPAAAEAPGSDAALELGLLHLGLGRRDEGRRQLAAVVAETAAAIGGPEDLLRVARAARALGEFRTANTYFREAATVADDDPGIHSAWGELFLEKHNRADALRSFRAALDADPEWVPAHVGLARALAEDDPTAAAAAAARALAIDPSSVEAHLAVAELELAEDRRAAAREAIDRALAVNPANLPARALLAGLAYVEDRLDDFEAEVDRALSVNAAYGEIFRVAGAQAARHYRFEQAAGLTRRALALDPDNPRAHADLGMHLLRTGEEVEAREILNRAFRLDPYDVVTYNLLGLLDTLEGFGSVESGPVTVRLHPDEAPILGEYVLSLVDEAFAALGERYGFSAEGPILIQMFPRHDDFAVRNLGLPGMVGALGACFGRVVTMNSPRARPPGTFDWQATLWHELAHVVTLQLSNQRVPRWLTEGLSVHEEQQARPEWGRDMAMTFTRALERGAVLPLDGLNAGFARPETIALAYYQASLVAEHLVDTYGYEAIRRLLAAYGEGLDTDAALAQVLGTDLNRLQETFDAAIEARFGALRAALAEPAGLATARQSGDLAALRRVAAAAPGSYSAQLALGHALRAHGDLPAALAAFERAAELVPMVTGDESPRTLMADIALELGDGERGRRELDALLAYDHTNLGAARRLAALAEAAQDERRLALAYERVVALDPFDPAPHAALGRLALARGDAQTAIREFRVALAAGPLDPAAAHCDLAEAYLREGRDGEAKRQALAALEIAPTFERAQELLLRAVEVRR